MPGQLVFLALRSHGTSSTTVNRGDASYARLIGELRLEGSGGLVRRHAIGVEVVGNELRGLRHTAWPRAGESRLHRSRSERRERERGAAFGRRTPPTALIRSHAGSHAPRPAEVDDGTSNSDRGREQSCREEVALRPGEQTQNRSRYPNGVAVGCARSQTVVHPRRRIVHRPSSWAIAARVSWSRDGRG